MSAAISESSDIVIAGAGSDGDPDLVAAAKSYDRVAFSLKSVWEHATKMKKFDDAELRNMSRSIREAGTAEKEGIAAIKTYLTTRWQLNPSRVS